MTKAAFRVLWLALALVAMLDSADRAEAAVQARFSNPNFEQGNTSGWRIYNPDSRALNWMVTDAAANVHGGKWAGTLTGFGGTGSLLLLYNQASIADLPAGTLVHVKFYLKTEGLAFQKEGVGISPILATLDGSGQVLTYASEAGRFVGTYDYTPVSFLLELPAGATTLWLQLSLGAGIKAGSLYVDDLSFEVIDAQPSLPPPDLVDCSVRRDSAGVPRLMMNGVAEPPVFFFGNSGNPVIYEEIAKARAAGLRLIQVPMQMPWTGMSTGMLEQILAANPDALILPRLSLFPPDSWLAAHPMAVIRNEQGLSAQNGAWPSPASDQLASAWKHQLEILIRFLQNSPYKNRVIGYHTGYLSTGEWFYPDTNAQYTDFSEDNRARFAQWATGRYGTLAELNTAWETSYGAFTQIQIPPATQWEQGDDGLFRDPRKRRWVMDFLGYQNELIADRLIELAGTIKTLTGGHRLASFFYGYQNELINNAGRRGLGHTGHLGLCKVLASPDVDMICSPISYYDRQVGGPANLMSIVDSITLAGKLCLQEEDSNTWLVDPSQNWDSFNPWYSTEWDTMQCLRRNFGNVISHNLAIWWMDLWADGRHNSTAIWQNNKKLIESYAESIRRALPACPQVALIYDEDSPLTLKSDSYDLNRPNGYEQRSIFQTSGLQVGYYHLQDLPRPARVGSVAHFRQHIPHG